MKIIKIDGRKTGVTIILLGLMIVMFGFAGHLNERFSFTVLVPYQTGSLKDYYGFDSRLSYKLPHDWNTDLKDLHSNDILYHNEFASPDFTVHGIVEVWKLNQDLKEFLQKSRKYSEIQNTIKGYNLTPVKINDREVFFATYVIRNKSNIEYRALEYFIKYKGGFLRFSFYMKDSFYKETMKASFENLVRTLNYNESSDDSRNLS